MDIPYCYNGSKCKYLEEGYCSFYHTHAEIKVCNRRLKRRQKRQKQKIKKKIMKKISEIFSKVRNDNGFHNDNDHDNHYDHDDNNYDYDNDYDDDYDNDYDYDDNNDYDNDYDYENDSEEDSVSDHNYGKYDFEKIYFPKISDQNFGKELKFKENEKVENKSMCNSENALTLKKKDQSPLNDALFAQISSEPLNPKPKQEFIWNFSLTSAQTQTREIMNQSQKTNENSLEIQKPKKSNRIDEEVKFENKKPKKSNLIDEEVKFENKKPATHQKSLYDFFLPKKNPVNPSLISQNQKHTDDLFLPKSSQPKFLDSFPYAKNDILTNPKLSPKKSYFRSRSRSRERSLEKHSSESFELSCMYCHKGKLIEKTEFCFFNEMNQKVYYCNLCHKRVTPGLAQRYNLSKMPNDKLIETQSFQKVPLNKIKEFLKDRNENVSGTKIDLWMKARGLLGMNPEDSGYKFRDEFCKTTIKKAVNESSKAFLDEFSKTLVVPPAALLEKICDTYRCWNAFDNDNFDRLTNVGDDFSVGLSGAFDDGNIVFYAPKKNKVLALFNGLTADMKWEVPLTKYYFTRDKIQIKICVNEKTGNIAVLQKSEEWKFSIFDEDKEWGFIVDRGVYNKAWYSFIDQKRKMFPGLPLAIENNKRFSVQVDRENIKKMKVDELRKACLERGLLKTNEKKVLKAELKERIKRIL